VSEGRSIFFCDWRSSPSGFPPSTCPFTRSIPSSFVFVKYFFWKADHDHPFRGQLFFLPGGLGGGVCWGGGWVGVGLGWGGRDLLPTNSTPLFLDTIFLLVFVRSAISLVFPYYRFFSGGQPASTSFLIFLFKKALHAPFLVFFEHVFDANFLLRMACVAASLSFSVLIRSPHPFPPIRLSQSRRTPPYNSPQPFPFLVTSILFTPPPLFSVFLVPSLPIPLPFLFPPAPKMVRVARIFGIRPQTWIPSFLRPSTPFNTPPPSSPSRPLPGSVSFASPL